MNKTCPAGHSNTPFPTKISVQFAPQLPASILVRRLLKIRGVATTGSGSPTLFQIAAQMDAPTTQGNFKPTQTITSKATNQLRMQATQQKSTKNNLCSAGRPDVGAAKAAPSPATGKTSASKNRGSRRELTATEFRLAAPNAASVKLAADFTDWEKHPVNLVKNMDGKWSTLIPLPPGRYAYRFIVDGEWHDDPHSARRAPNPFGTADSIVEIIGSQ